MMRDIILGVVFIVLASIFFVISKRQTKAADKLALMNAVAGEDELPEDGKKKKRRPFKRVAPVVLTVLFAWAAIGCLITGIFGAKQGEFGVEIFAPMVDLGFIQLSTSTIYGLIVSVVIVILALLFRFIAVPRFKDKPSGIQNALEIVLETAESYTESTLRRTLGDNLIAYIITLGAFLIGCASLELLGVRSPTSDLLTTFSLALVTFFLINYYGIKEKGFKGRLKHYLEPSPLLAPITLLSDIAVPVSMACRMFGNMLAGLIVMELLYFALGNFASGIPAVVGLFFNLFHPLMQAFVFITLTLSFIEEAVEGAPIKKKRTIMAKARVKIKE